MTMFSTVVFYLIILAFSSFLLVPILSAVIGFIQGLQNRNGNGFSDFVNTSRWRDGK